MERRNDKRRRAKYSTGQPALPIAAYRDESQNVRSLDSCWTYHQGSDFNASNQRNERRQSNSAIDHKYCCSSDAPRTSRNHGLISNSSRVKYVIPQIQDECSDIDTRILATPRPTKNQLLRHYANSAKLAKNVAIVKRNRYVDDFNEIEELENTAFTENPNVAEETSEEVEESREDVADFDEKDYEEHEADDEIDEESDVLERQTNRIRLARKMRVESLPRGQKISSAPVASHHHRGVKISKGKISERCSSAADRKPAEIATEEEEVEEEEEEPEIRESASYSPRTPFWRLRQREESTCIPGRKLTERYSDLPERSLLTDNRQTRRPGTMRPDVKATTKGQRYDTICNTKCDRCSKPSGQTPKTTSSRNASCRLEDSQYFTGEPNGDDYFEESIRGSATYQTKLRRSKEARSPIYESSRKGLTIDDEEKNENGGIYKTCRGKNSRETSNLRRPNQRSDDRRDEKSGLKNKRYWLEQ